MSKSAQIFVFENVEYFTEFSLKAIVMYVLVQILWYSNCALYNNKDVLFVHSYVNYISWFNLIVQYDWHI